MLIVISALIWLACREIWATVLLCLALTFFFMPVFKGLEGFVFSLIKINPDLDKVYAQSVIFVFVFLFFFVSSVTASPLIQVIDIPNFGSDKDIIVNEKAIDWESETKALSKLYKSVNFYSDKSLRERPCNIETRISRIGVSLLRIEETTLRINNRSNNLKERLDNYNDNRLKIEKRVKNYNKYHEVKFELHLADVKPLQVNELNLTPNYDRIKLLFSYIVDSAQIKDCTKKCSFNKIDQYSFDINTEIALIESFQAPINKELSTQENLLLAAEKNQKLIEDELTAAGV